MKAVKTLARNAMIHALRFFAPRHGLKDTDVILAAYPKTGSTWLRFIHANLVSLCDLDGRTVDYHRLNGEFAAEYDPHRFPDVSYAVLPRLVKSHQRFRRRAFGANSSVLLYRNPADVLVSFYEYRRARKDAEHVDASLSEFIRHPDLGLSAWVRHLRSWADQADYAIAYESMRANPGRSVRDFLDFLGADIRSEVIDQAIERSSFSRVREMEESRGLDERARSHLTEGFRFARKGAVGGWKGRLARDDLEYLRESLSASGILGLSVAGKTIRETDSGFLLL